MRIPFNKPSVTSVERQHLDQALSSGHYSGDGEYTKRCHAFLETKLGVLRALLTTSCTHALEMCAILLDVGPGDEVIMPSYTFVSTVNAFVLRGARPVFCDIRSDTLNLDERLLVGLITTKTKAIVVVHYAGVACNMEAIMSIANNNGIPVVEDNAHGFLGKYEGKWLGTFGALATQSFHETKNISCGEGGALLINDKKYVERAEILREKGTNRSKFFRGQIDKYSWVDLGSSYLPSDLLAAVLYGQFERSLEIQARRRLLWERYHNRLATWAGVRAIRRPVVPENCEQAWHMYYLLFRDNEARGRMIEHLKKVGIMAVFHYLPLHLSVMGKRLGGATAQCPITTLVSEQLLRLPLYFDISEHEQDEIIRFVTSAPS